MAHHEKIAADSRLSVVWCDFYFSYFYIKAHKKYVVTEPNQRGLKLFDNPIGIMAVGPRFQWHMALFRPAAQTGNFLRSSDREISLPALIKFSGHGADI